MSDRISIIIPVYREAEAVAATLARALELGSGNELIVVDGDPRGSTIGAIDGQGVVCICSQKGRAAQLNAGARVATGEILLFLHADTLLPPSALDEIAATLEDSRFAGGCFDLLLDDDSRILRAYSTIINYRTRLWRIPVGDQAIFLRRRVFDAVGGYPDVPILEEVELMWRLRRGGYRIRVSSQRVVVSARKFLDDGPLRRIALNTLIGALYYLGVSPGRLVGLYVDSD